MNSKIAHLIKILLVFAWALSPLLYQSQIINKVYPTAKDKTARDLLRTSDGGYLIVGMTNTDDEADSHLYVLKTNSNGDFLWDTVYGGPRPDYAYSMVGTHDGKIIVAGFTQSFGGGDYDMYLLKLDENGKFIKQVDYGTSGNEEARQIIRTKDNKYVVVGTKAMGSSNSQIMVLRMDENLDNIQEVSFGGTGSSHDYGLAIQETPEGDFMVGGQTWSEGAGGGDAYAVRLKGSDLSTVWTKTYGQVDNEEIVGLVVNGDGTSILAIRDSLPNEPNDGNIDVWIVKIKNDNGEKLYDKTFGGALKDTPKSIFPLGNSEYIVGAISRTWWPSPQMWLLKIKDNGSSLDTVWARNFGEVNSDHDHCHIAKASNDGGILVAGHSRTNMMRVWFMKLNDEGKLVVSLDENTLVSANILVFPNPVIQGVLKVKSDKNAAYTVRVHNILGDVIYVGGSGKGSGETIEIDMKGQPAGVYIVNVQSGESQISRKVVLR